MSMKCQVLNRMCMLLYGREYRKFMEKCSVEQVQSD